MSILLSFLIFISLFFVGHYAAALVVYLNHRFVFHGSLRRWPGLKYLARLHALHHAHVDNDVAEYIFMPWWGQLAVVLTIGLTGWLFSWGLALGIFSFSILYMNRHLAIHTTDEKSHFHFHHIYHHRGDVKTNLSGMYPFIDRLFGTYVESRPGFPPTKKDLRKLKLAPVKVRISS